MYERHAKRFPTLPLPPSLPPSLLPSGVRGGRSVALRHTRLVRVHAWEAGGHVRHVLPGPAHQHYSQSVRATRGRREGGKEKALFLGSCTHSFNHSSLFPPSLPPSLPPSFPLTSYYYAANNPSEATIAKRRSYAR